MCRGWSGIEVERGSRPSDKSLYLTGPHFPRLTKGVMQVFSQVCGCNAFECVDRSSELD